MSRKNSALLRIILYSLALVILVVGSLALYFYTANYTANCAFNRLFRANFGAQFMLTQSDANKISTCIAYSRAVCN